MTKLTDKEPILLPKADNRYSKGKIVKDNNGNHRGHSKTVSLKVMDVPNTAPIEMQLNPPMIASPELVKYLESLK